MKQYSQKDKKWRNIKVGFGNQTCYSVGCFLCSLSMIAEIEPPEANELLKKNGGYSGNLIKSAEAGEALGLEYEGRIYKNPDYPCIIEVDFIPETSKKDQHFVVMTDPTHILDPLNYPVKEKKNPYPIVSYRLFNKPNQKTMKEHKVKETLKAAEKYFGLKLGDRINSSEDREIADSIKEMYNEVVDLTHIYTTIDTQADMCQRDLEKEIEKNRKLSFSLGRYHTKTKIFNVVISEKDKEIKELKALKEKNYQAIGILSRLAEAIRMVLKY